MIDRHEVFAERQPAAGPHGVAGQRFVAVPFRGRELFHQSLQLIGECRRGDRLGQDAQAGPLFGEQLFATVKDQRLQVLPGVDPSVVGHHLRAVRVVEREDRGLAEDVDGAQAGGVGGVAFEIGRAGPCGS